jgi:signal transduction histidine kinase
MIRAYRENWGYLVAVFAIPATFWVRPDFLKLLFESNGFIPHGHCYLWQPNLVWLHLVSDLLTALSYVSISATLAYLVYRTRKEIPFDWMFLAFGTFIVACGSTHFMAVWTLWHPTYWLAGALKAITAFASVATAAALPALVPQAKSLIEDAKVSEERRLHLESANEKLKELDQLKTQFFANVSHELRTPLTLILGPTEKLQSSSNLTGDQHYNLEVIARNARFLLKQVNDLLDVSKLEAGEIEVHHSDFDLAQLVKMTAANFDGLAQEQQINFLVETPETLPSCLDEAKVERILLNLLSNAFKFTPAQGTIRCTLSTLPNPANTATAQASSQAQNIAQITIEDSGPGVPATLREAIFERFRQGEGSANRRFGGTGLGLAIVKEFVELQEGHIAVGDSPYGGARFTLELPLMEAPATDGVIPSPSAKPAESFLAQPVLDELWPHPQGQQPQPPGQDTGKPLVLVVEDNLEMQRFIASTLEDNYQIATAKNGQEGLEQAADLHPDIILCDVMMPQMSGDQLVKQIRTQPDLSDIPIVMLTAKADEALQVQLLQEGVQDYLMKPFSIGELRARVSNIVAIKRTRNLLQQELTSQSHDLEALAQQLSLRKQEVQHAYERLQHQAAELARASRLKDEFLAVISHELRTPLNSIIGWAKLLRSRSLNEETTARALETVERNALQQANLVEDLLDISRLLGGKLQFDMHPVDLKPLIQMAVQSLQSEAEAKGVQLEAALSDGATWVTGNSPRLQQVFHNLLSNAIKFTPAGGQAKISLAREGDFVKAQVSDTGEGIDPEFLPHVFDYFRQEDSSETRRYGGLGLGLAIAQCLVKLHQGQIQVASQGKSYGVTVTITFPPLSSRKPIQLTHDAASILSN